MKTTYLFNLILTLIISTCLFGELKAQVIIIPNVPDLQQPIDPWWGNLLLTMSPFCWPTGSQRLACISSSNTSSLKRSSTTAPEYPAGGLLE